MCQRPDNRRSGFRRSGKVTRVVAGVAPLLVATAAFSQQCPRQWVQVNPPVSPPARHEGFFGGDFFLGSGVEGVLFGGIGSTGALNDTWIWSRSQANNSLPRWEFVPLSSAPPPTSNGAMLVKSMGQTRELSLFGGLTHLPGGVLPTANQWSFDIISRTWQLAPGAAAQARWNCAAAELNGMLIFGGQSDTLPGTVLLNSIFNLTYPSTMISPPSPQGVTSTSAAHLSSQSIAIPFGDTRTTNGSAYVANPAVYKLERLPTGFFEWQVLAWPMAPRANYALTSRRIESQQRYEVVLFGGDDGTFPSSTGLYGDTWILDPVTGQFSQVQGVGPSPRRARNQMAYDRVKDQFVLFGGHNGEYLNDTWVLTKSPVLRNQSLSQTHCSGQTLTLSVDVGWTGLVNYFWFRDDVLIDPVTNPSSSTNTLVIPDFSLTEATFFRCVFVAACNLSGDGTRDIVITPAAAGTCITCDTIDFNNNTLFPEDQDLVDFLAVLAGGPCSNDPNCNDIDFNNDGLFPSDDDLVAFLRVLAGGVC